MQSDSAVKNSTSREESWRGRVALRLSPHLAGVQNWGPLGCTRVALLVIRVVIPLVGVVAPP